VCRESTFLAVLSDGRWPTWRLSTTPFALAATSPLLTRSRIRSRSNSAKPAIPVSVSIRLYRETRPSLHRQRAESEQTQLTTASGQRASHSRESPRQNSYRLSRCAPRWRPIGTCSLLRRRGCGARGVVQPQRCAPGLAAAVLRPNPDVLGSAPDVTYVSGRSSSG
jgi:hypothetical protein